MNRLLALVDSPTKQTGFARVGQNLLGRWLKRAASVDYRVTTPSGTESVALSVEPEGFFDQIDVWGIGYQGWPHQQPYRIFPATDAGDMNWSSPANLSRFLQLLYTGGYTHVWMLQDLFQFHSNFPEMFKKACDEKNIRSLLYFPVDAPVNEDWLAIIKAVDVAVAYTEYGRDEVAQWRHKIRLEKIPHGVDTSVYHPLVSTRNEMVDFRRQALNGAFANWLKPDDLMLLNVNTHSRRKGLVNTFEIVATLKQMGLPVKLFMNMPRKNVWDATDLTVMAAQCGLKSGVDWKHNDDCFTPGGNPQMTEEQLCELYNCADLSLTTTLGEGWGLPACESVSCGCPATFPQHTACKEIGDTLEEMGCDGIVRLPISETGVVMPIDNNRLRYPVDVPGAAKVIAEFFGKRVANPERKPLPEAAKEWMNWDRIAAEWVKLF